LVSVKKRRKQPKITGAVFTAEKKGAHGGKQANRQANPERPKN
jgi:hypothetical protein